LFFLTVNRNIGAHGTVAAAGRRIPCFGEIPLFGYYCAPVFYLYLTGGAGRAGKQ
jgi:hypothetical protein